MEFVLYQSFLVQNKNTTETLNLIYGFVFRCSVIFPEDKVVYKEYTKYIGSQSFPSRLSSAGHADMTYCVLPEKNVRDLHFSKRKWKFLHVENHFAWICHADCKYNAHKINHCCCILCS